MPRAKKYTEEDVIQKAMETFWKNGYEGTSIRDLEKAMGINLFSIYSSFSDKEGVMLKALECYEKQLYKTAVVKLVNSNNGIHDIKQYFYDFLDFVKEDKVFKGCFLTNSLVEVGSREDKINKRVLAFAGMVKNIFKTKLIEAKEKKQIAETANVEAYSNYLMGSLQGLATSSKVFEMNALKDFIEISFQNIK